MKWNTEYNHVLGQPRLASHTCPLRQWVDLKMQMLCKESRILDSVVKNSWEKKVKQGHTSQFAPDIMFVSIVTLGGAEVGVRQGPVSGVHGNKGSILQVNL